MDEPREKCAALLEFNSTEWSKKSEPRPSGSGQVARFTRAARIDLLPRPRADRVRVRKPRAAAVDLRGQIALLVKLRIRFQDPSPFICKGEHVR